MALTGSNCAGALPPLNFDYQNPEMTEPPLEITASPLTYSSEVPGTYIPNIPYEDLTYPEECAHTPHDVNNYFLLETM